MFPYWVALQLWWRCNYSEYGSGEKSTKLNGQSASLALGVITRIVNV